MAQEIIDVGLAPNDGQGDPIRTAYIKCNNNFGELFSRAQETPPATLVGSIGDTAGMYAYDSTYFYYCFANYDGSSTIWAQVTQVGNITVPNIVNGNSNVNIASANDNITVSVDGTSNVVVFTRTAVNASVPLNTTQSISATGNITGGNLTTIGSVSAVGNVTGQFIIGNGALLTGIVSNGGGAGNAISSGFSTVAIPSLNGNVVISVGLIGPMAEFNTQGLSVTGSVTGGQLIASSTANITGTATVGNLSTAGTVSATGNVTGGNVLTAGAVSALGNITGQYIIGNGALLTGISGGSGDYGNANVAGFLPTYTGNLSAGAVSVTGNVDVDDTVNGDLVGDTTGVHTGLVYSIDIRMLSWDFGFIAANTYTNPMQFLLNNAGNIDMGTIISPSPLNIDIGTLS